MIVFADIVLICGQNSWQSNVLLTKRSCRTNFSLRYKFAAERGVRVRKENYGFGRG